MNTTILKSITSIAFAVLLTLVQARAQTAPVADDTASTPAFKAFEESYIAAVNTKDRAKLTVMLHPHSAADFATDKALADMFFQSRFSETVPAEHKTIVTVIPAAQPLPFAEMGFSFPVRPTHQFDLSFNPTPNHLASITGYIVFKDGKWLEVAPIKK